MLYNYKDPHEIQAAQAGDVEPVDEATDSWVQDQLDEMSRLMRQSVCEHKYVDYTESKHGTHGICHDCGKVIPNER